MSGRSGWAAQALCAQPAITHLWFSFNRDQQEQAAAWCLEQCSVLRECERYAAAQGRRVFGVIAGATMAQRDDAGPAKRCARCEELLPRWAFYAGRQQSWCKRCTRDYSRQRYDGIRKSPEEVLAARRANAQKGRDARAARR